MISSRLQEFCDELACGILCMSTDWQGTDLASLPLQAVLEIYLCEFLPPDEQVWGETMVLANTMHFMLKAMDAELDAIALPLFLEAGKPILLRCPKFEWAMLEGELGIYEATSSTAIPVPRWLN